MLIVTIQHFHNDASAQSTVFTRAYGAGKTDVIAAADRATRLALIVRNEYEGKEA